MTKFKWFILALMMFMMTGCYSCSKVESNEVGLRLNDGVSITDVVGPGRYTDMSNYADLVVIDTSIKTFTWSDPDLVTRDKQPIGLEIGYSVRRNPDTAGIKMMYNAYRLESTDDGALQAFVNNRIPRVAKSVTAKFSLDDMLGVGEGGELAPNREVLQGEIFKLLQDELTEANIILTDVGVNNITPSADYMDSLKRKAASQVQAEIEKTEAATLAQQLEKEKALTAIEIEKAQRRNAVELENAKVLQLSPEALQLKKLEVIAGAIGDNDKIFFVPPGADFTMFFTPEGAKPSTEIMSTSPITPVDQLAPLP